MDRHNKTEKETEKESNAQKTRWTGLFRTAPGAPDKKTASDLIFLPKNFSSISDPSKPQMGARSMDFLCSKKLMDPWSCPKLPRLHKENNVSPHSVLFLSPVSLRRRAHGHAATTTLAPVCPSPCPAATPTSALPSRDRPQRHQPPQPGPASAPSDALAGTGPSATNRRALAGTDRP